MENTLTIFRPFLEMDVRLKFVQKHLNKKKKSKWCCLYTYAKLHDYFASQVFIMPFFMDLDFNVWRSSGSIFILGTQLKVV